VANRAACPLSVQTFTPRLDFLQWFIKEQLGGEDTKRNFKHAKRQSGGEIATNDLENQELTMLALHLLQICLVYSNTLMIQRVLTEPDWTQRMLRDDLRALTPLIYAHVTPYGTFRLDMSQRLAIEKDAVAA
jgi:hypothetical protein